MEGTRNTREIPCYKVNQTEKTILSNLGYQIGNTML